MMDFAPWLAAVSFASFGLLASCATANAEPLQTQSQAYLFDVDGVLTNLQTKRVEHNALFDEIILRLSKGEWIGLNTGRALEYMIENVLTPIEGKINDRNLLQQIFASGEKGAVTLVYDLDGNHITQVDAAIQISPELRAQIRDLVGKPPYADLVFFDETKLSMVSIEVRHGIAIAEFAVHQSQLGQDLKELISQQQDAESYFLDSSVTSFDIQKTQVGKDLGARKYVNWLQFKGHDPKHYFAFGDSRSDYAMLVELRRLEKNVTFIFVGNPQVLNGKDTQNVVFPAAPFDSGTLLFLQSQEMN